MGIDTALRKLSAHLRSAYRLLYATVPDLKKRNLDLSIARMGTKVLLPAGTTRETTPAEPLAARPRGTRGAGRPRERVSPRKCPCPCSGRPRALAAGASR